MLENIFLFTIKQKLSLIVLKFSTIHFIRIFDKYFAPKIKSNTKPENCLSVYFQFQSPSNRLQKDKMSLVGIYRKNVCDMKMKECNNVQLLKSNCSAFSILTHCWKYIKKPVNSKDRYQLIDSTNSPRLGTWSNIISSVYKLSSTLHFKIYSQ